MATEMVTLARGLQQRLLGIRGGGRGPVASWLALGTTVRKAHAQAVGEQVQDEGKVGHNAHGQQCNHSSAASTCGGGVHLQAEEEGQ